MRALLTLIPLALALVPVAACGNDDDIAITEDDLSQAGKKLIGEYLEQGSGAFRGLALTSEKVTSNSNRFFADIDTGIVCVTTPCPSVERVEGTFTAGTKTITLKSDTASELVQEYLGKYKYTLSSSGKFSLSKNGFQQSLEAVESYCAYETAEADCNATAEGPVVTCVGSWSCSAEASCEFECGGSKDCGGFAGFVCDDDEYCDYDVSQMCGAGDQMGTCKAKPDVCPLGCPAPEYQPCGCDGQLYCNECEANKAGVDVSGNEGSCDGALKTCGGFLGLTCGDDEFCDYAEGEMCGAADQMGTCQPRPDNCPLGCPAPQYQPCGCDGELYCNECFANRSGVDVSGDIGSCN